MKNIKQGMEMKRETERDRQSQVLSGQTFTIFEDALTVSAQDGYPTITANPFSSQVWSLLLRSGNP